MDPARERRGRNKNRPHMKWRVAKAPAVVKWTPPGEGRIEMDPPLHMEWRATTDPAVAKWTPPGEGGIEMEPPST